MATDWAAFKARRERIKQTRGEYVGLLDRNYDLVTDVEDWESAEWGRGAREVGSMQIVLPGLLPDGSRNPIINDLVRLSDVLKGDILASGKLSTGLDKVLHESVHFVVERPHQKRRCYRVRKIVPEGGDLWPDRVTVTGVDLLEHYKHLPLWADPSNRSKVAQLQFSDTQRGSAELVSRKLIMRSLLGYFQPSLLFTSLAWTNDTATVQGHWERVIPDLHPVMCAPLPSGIDSDYAIVEARWDNAWDLLKPTWDAAGIVPTADLWLPGDPQPFPNHTTLAKPTVIFDFKPRAVSSGAVGYVGQILANIKRMIDQDDFTSILTLDQAQVPGADGRMPWVVFDLLDAPPITIEKSTDWRFLVGGQSPKIVNDLVETGIKTAVAAIVASIPGIGPALAELIKGGGEMLGKLSADRFLNLSEFSDQVRREYHGRSAYISLSKTGQGNSLDTLQKAWQAKTDTDGSISVEFEVESADPYVPGRDFDVGDLVGVRAWGVVWAAVVADMPWTSRPGEPDGLVLKLGNMESLADAEALLAQNAEAVRSVLGRMATAVNGSG